MVRIVKDFASFPEEPVRLKSDRLSEKVNWLFHVATWCSQGHYAGRKLGLTPTGAVYSTTQLHQARKKWVTILVEVT